MRNKYLQKIGSQKKALYLAVAATILAGSSFTSVQAKDYEEPLILGVTDSVFRKDGATRDGYSFKFIGTNTINTHNRSGIYYGGTEEVKKPVLRIGEHMTINAKGSMEDMLAGLHSDGIHRNIEIRDNGLLEINASNSYIKPEGRPAYPESGAAGILLTGGADERNRAGSLTINSNVKIEVSSVETSHGIRASASWHRTELNGDTSIKIMNKDAKSPYAIFMSGGTKSPVVNINYDHDFTQKIGDDTGWKFVNTTTVDKIKDESKTVQIDGDLYIRNNWGTNYDENPGRISLGLSGEDSYFHGVAMYDSGYQVSHGVVNMALMNGAQWVHEKYGNQAYRDGFDKNGSQITTMTGGVSQDKAGLIYQKDVNPITLRHYSGYTTIFYEHANDGTSSEDYRAGDVNVLSAKEGSSITVLTDSKNIDMQNDDQVYQVLYTLAGKLVYKGAAETPQGYENDSDFTEYNMETGRFETTVTHPEHNLSGHVGIASGLTASAEVLNLQDMTFNKETGRGEYIIHQTQTEYDELMNGIRNAESVYTKDHVLQPNNIYLFTKDTKISNATGDSVANAVEAIKIDSRNHKLTLQAVDNGNENAYAIKSRDKEVEIRAQELWAQATSKGQGEAAALKLTGNQAQAKLEGDIHLEAHGQQDAVAIATDGGAVNIKGKLTVADTLGGAGVTAAQGRAAGLQASGTGSINVQGTTQLKVAGDVLVTEDQGKIAFDGEVKLHSALTPEQEGYAIRAEGGTVDIHKVEVNDKSSSGEGEGGGGEPLEPLDAGFAPLLALDMDGYQVYEDDNFGPPVGGDGGNTGNQEPLPTTVIQVDGNIKAVGTVNLGMETKDSYWTGVAVGDNLHLTNIYGATWTNEVVGQAPVDFAGSTLASYTGSNYLKNAGTIFQKDSHDLTIKEYKGNAFVIYEHANAGTDSQDYAAGNTVINKAAANANIVLVTDNKGITMDDDAQVSSVLNALAGKLIYSGFVEGERNLTGTAQIADGLTASGAQKSMEIVFNEATGQGGTQVAASFTEALTGEAQELYRNNNTQLLDKSYFFTRATAISNGAGNAALVTKGEVRVNAAGHNLSFTTHVADAESAYGIQADKDVAVKAQNIKLQVTSGGNGAATGIFLDGAVADINGNLDLQVQGNQATGIHIQGTDGGLLLNGDVNITSQGAGIVVDGAQNDVVVNGGVIINAEGNAVTNAGGSVELNAYLDEKLVDIKGNIDAQSETILGMGTAESSWQGAALGNQLQLRAFNGATWTNELQGNEPEDFTGSVVHSFISGTNDSSAGVILQKDTHKLTINNYSGHGYVIYEHQGDGTALEDYVAGDTIIKHAEPKSEIILSTDNSNIDMGNKEQVNAVLIALAGKLYYENYVTGENNLAPKVQIADGLTASGAQKIVDIEFNKESGQGFYIPSQSLTTYTEKLTGAEQAVYIEDLVQQPDKKYIFSLNTKIDGSAQGSALEAQEKIDINTKGHDLILSVHNEDSSSNTAIAGMVLDQEDVHILTGNRVGKNTPGLIDIQLVNKGTGTDAHATGIVFNSGSKAKLTIDGNVQIASKGNQSSIGIDAGGGQVEINGDLGMWFTMNGGDKSQTVGIKASSKDGVNGGQVTINGATNMMIGGTAVVAEGNAVVNLNGDININLLHRKEKDDFAIRAGAGSTVNLNADMLSQENADKVFIKGHIDATGEVNLGLTGAWDGMLKGDNLNLMLWNNARWNPTCEGKTPAELKHSNVATLMGMDSWANAGTIYQQQSGHKLTVNDFSGKVYVVYTHTGNGSSASDYAAGDTVIKHAAEGSGIILSTSNKGISSVDRSLINDVLNTLAGKLVYEGYVSGERNLDAQVQIADGMTASGVKKRVDVQFDEETGRGGYTYAQKGNVFNEMMTGTRQEVYQKESAQEFDNSYLFTKDTSVTNAPGEHSVIHAVGGIIVDTMGHNLELNANQAPGSTEDLSGIRLGTYKDNNVEMTTGFRPIPGQEAVIDLKVNNLGSGATTGILFDGQEYAELNMHGSMDVQVAGQGPAIGVDNNDGRMDVTGNFNLDMTKAEGENVIGIRAVKVGVDAHEDQHRGSVVIRNDANITVNGDGLVAEGEGASIDIWGIIGLKVVGNDDKERYAVRAGEGSIVKLNAAGRNNVVTIEGNILAEGEVATQLVNDKAFIHGVAVGGGLKITANNGGYWINESYGKAPTDFSGSHIALFDGTYDKVQNARTVIFQKDAGSLTIDKYAGHSVLIYDHVGNGAQAEDFTAGDTIIKNADNWSSIIVSTDRTGINMEDEDNVQAVLCNLANKLWYLSSDVNTNLQAKAQIADGLTGSSQALQIGDIRFNEQHQGEFVVESMNPGVNKFITSLTGEVGRDGEYAQAGVIQNDGAQYIFRPESNTKILVHDASGVSLHDGDVELQVKDGTLRVATEAVYGNYQGDFLGLSAFSKIGSGRIVVDAADLVLSTDNKEKNRAEALHLENSSQEKTAQMLIKGNLRATAYGEETAIGVFTKGNSSLEVQGKVIMQGADGAYGVDNFGTGDYGYFNASALYAGSDYKTRGSDITVLGGTDIMINGSGAIANGGGAAITLNGPTKIITAKNDSQKHYALAAASGSIAVNMVDGKAGNDAVVLQGNVGVLTDAVNPNEAVKHSEINLALNSEDSSLQGVIINQFVDHPTDTGAVNLILANGALWQNEEYGLTSDVGDDPWSYKFNGSRVTSFQGGADRNHAGVILQKDAHDLTIDNYSGHSYIIYEHTGDGTQASDYAAGDTIVKHAAPDAEIIISTDNSGINMSDIFAQNAVLDTLAGKLTYEAFTQGETNLQGKAQIASGLTASGVQRIVDITFDQESGKGGYKVEVDATDFDAPLTGMADPAYQLAGVQQEDRSYLFTEHATIKNGVGPAAINALDKIKVQAAEKQLALLVTQESADEGAYGILAGQTAQGALDITAGAVNIDVQNKGEGTGANAAGIYLTGDYAQENIINGALNINRVEGQRLAQGIYNNGGKLILKGDVAMQNIKGQQAVGIAAHSNEQGAAQILVEGNTAIQVAGTGLLLDGQGATVDITGTTNIQAAGDGILLKGTADAVDLKGKTTIKAEQRGLVVTGAEGQILLQQADIAAGAEAIVAQGVDSLVNIKSGNISAGAEHYAIVAQSGATVNINAVNTMTLANETVTAPTVNDIFVNGDIYSAGTINQNLVTANSVFKGLAFADGGTINLQLTNGAQWFNQGNGAAAENTSFQGSTITNFTGGSGYGPTTGVIHQKDSHKLTIENYSGFAVAVYEHDAADPTLLKGGSIQINKAAAGSGIKLYTDNLGLDMNATEQLDAVLGSLAQKLIYTEAMNGTENLQAQVLIAGGLTSSSTGWEGQVAYDAATGQGQFVAGSSGKVQVTPIGGSTDAPIITGPDETTIMRGVRSVTMSNMLMWTDNAQDMKYRTAALRQGAEDGVWARTFGGKAKKYEGNNTQFTTDYWGAQVGYDAAVGHGWNLGTAFNYVDGEGSYEMGGEGDNKLYSLGAYASKKLGDSGYVDFAAKFGQVEGDYTVYNEIQSTDLSGKYKAMGYSFSAQIGKRLGNAEKFYVEPQMQLTWSHLDGDNYNAYSRAAESYMSINQDDFDSVIGRVGIELGRVTSKGGFYGGFSFSHEFSGDVDASYRADDGGAKTTSFNLGETWTELTLGGYGQLADNSYFYADVTKSLSGDYKQEWKVDAGINFSF